MGRKEPEMMKITMTLAILAIVAAFSACGGDDNPNPPCDETQADCQPAPDAGVENSDAAPATPDAAPLTSALCPAEIVELNDTWWDCGGVENGKLTAWNSCPDDLWSVCDETGQCRIAMTPGWGGYTLDRIMFEPDMWGLTTTDGTHCDRLI